MGKGAQLKLACCHIESICPVKATIAYLEVRGQDQGYFFKHRDNSPLTKCQFWKLTDLALDRVGMQGSHFGTHSFRIGAASTAAVLGYNTDEIKSLGWWSSSSSRRYIRTLPNI